MPSRFPSTLPRQLWRRSSSPRTSLIRRFSAHPARMAASLPQVNPPVSSVLPSDSFQLLSPTEKVGAAEDSLYDQQIEDVKNWWSSPRYEGIRRPYTAEDVVSKRGSLQITYPSSIMARKLFNLLNERAAEGKPVHTSKRGFPEWTEELADEYLQWAPLIQYR